MYSSSQFQLYYIKMHTFRIFCSCFRTAHKNRMFCVNPSFGVSFGYQQYISLFWDTAVWRTQTHSDCHELLLMILIRIWFNMQKHLYNRLCTLCMRVRNIFRSQISQLIFITYLDPQVSFQADLWRGHASVSRLI